MALVERMLRAVSQAHPQFGRLVKSLGTALQIHQPLEVEGDDKKELTVRCKKAIAANQPLLMVAADECFTTLEWTGADRVKSEKYDELVKNAVRNNFSSHRADEMFRVYKLGVQVLTHYNDPSMRLHEYSKFLMQQQIRSGPFVLPPEEAGKIASESLLGTLVNTRKNYESIGVDLYRDLPGLDIAELFHAVLIAQSRAIVLKENILCPVVDLLKRQLEPNCILDGMHLSHLQRSFVCVRSLKNLSVDEQLTIGLGQLGNIDLYFKYGYALENNPYNYYMLRVNYDEHLQWLGRLFDLKEKLLSAGGGLKEFIKVNRHSIDKEALGLLRVFFLTEEDLMQNSEISIYSLSQFWKPVNEMNEQRVNEFLLKQLQQNKPPSPSDVPGANIIEKNDQEIHAATLQRIKKQLKR